MLLRVEDGEEGGWGWGLLVGLLVGDGETRGGEGGWMEGGREAGREGGRGGLTIREKFRPVKVSFLPIVLLIKTAPAPELIEGLSLSLTLSPPSYSIPLPHSPGS